MKVSSVWNVNEFAKQLHCDSFDYLAKELPENLVSIEFESKEGRDKYISKFQKEQNYIGVKLYQTLFSSRICVGYSADVENKYFVHIEPSYVKGENCE